MPGKIVDTHSLPFPPLLHPLPLLHALRHVHLGLQKYKNTQNTEICLSWSSKIQKYSKYRNMSILVLVKIRNNTRYKNIDKGTTDPRVECSHQINCFLVISQVDKNFASESQGYFSFKILTNRQYQNLDYDLASKPRPNSSLKISTKLKPQKSTSIFHT